MLCEPDSALHSGFDQIFSDYFKMKVNVGERSGVIGFSFAVHFNIQLLNDFFAFVEHHDQGDSNTGSQSDQYQICWSGSHTIASG